MASVQSQLIYNYKINSKPKQKKKTENNQSLNFF